MLSEHPWGRLSSLHRKLAICATIKHVGVLVSGIVFVATVLPARTPAQTSNEANFSTQTSNSVQRTVLFVRASRDVIFDEPINSLIVINPEIVKAEQRTARLVTFTALAQGETIVIVSGASHRQTLAFEVRGNPDDTPEQIATRALRAQRQQRGAYGSYSVSFSPVFTGGPSVLRQSFDYRRKLNKDRTVRIEGDTFKFFGRGDRALSFGTEPSLGLDRLALGIDTQEMKIDLLDSELIVSPLSFNGYTMRGLHVLSAPDSRWRGVELFAGLARPSLTLLQNSGYLGGVILPVAGDKNWRLRAGVLAVASQHNSFGSKNGLVWQAISRYQPNDRTSADGEVAYAEGGLSWRVRLDLRRGPFTVNGETLRLDGRSPLVSIGAQAGGRRMDALNVNWQPNARFNASITYNRFAVVLPRSQGAKLNNSMLFASANYSLTRDSRFGFRFNEQKIETAVSDSSSLLHLHVRTAAITHNIQFAKYWANDLEVGFTSSHEQESGTRLERGLTLREELRRSWERWSATAYLNYTGNTPSLASLLVQNPQILPPALRSAFITDPARFIIFNRDALPGLLAGVTLPTTRSKDVGLRFQGVLSRYTLSGDVRLSSGESVGMPRRDLLATFGASMRLDAANTLQISGARSFMSGATSTPSSITLSYTHRFGAGSGGGFQFSRLLGLEHGRIAGRAFFDLNSNGQDDPGEPGIGGMKIQLDAKHVATTDEAGRFSFSSIDAGDHQVALVSDDLGVKLRASTPTQQQVFLEARQTMKVVFGVTNFGFISGRIFNDIFLTGEQGPQNAPGVRGVQISLRPAGPGAHGPTFTETVDASGAFSFRDLPPGTYTLEIDPMTLPADFRVPARTSWTITVEPLKGSYLDIPIAAQRAIAGVVFRDKDNDGQFDPQKDEVLAGARVIVGNVEALSDQNGSYMVRNLPAGKIEVRARLGSGDESNVVTITLGSEPNVRRAVNLAIAVEAATASRQH